jgi:hypothetical protein
VRAITEWVESGLRQRHQVFLLVSREVFSDSEALLLGKRERRASGSRVAGSEGYADLAADAWR